MKKILFIFTTFILIGAAASAQNTENPWLIGVSTNYADFHTVEKSLGDQFSDADWMGNTMPSMLRIGRNINKSFNASALFGIVELEPDRLNMIPLDRQISSDNFWKLGVQLEYKLANDYLLNETSFIDPYLFLGMNNTSIDEVSYLSSSMGVGINVWPLEQFGVNFQGSYDYNWDFNDYMHYSIGLVFRFGKKQDADGDGIADKKDLCPEVAGLAQFQGCPDTDGDGIQDSEDQCPRDAGPLELNGCPDTDGDGIPDKDDLCPDEAGPAEFDGCPDSDGDGIIDKNDRCPNVPGVEEFVGCPDTDGDGIPDSRDNCPEEAGPASNMGCPEPEIEEVVIETIDFNAQDIQFEINSANLKRSSIEKLDNIVEIMKEFPTAEFTIYGYTDITGPDDFNLQLSKERAQAVKDYLVEKGINANRLEAGGFGEQNPIAPNDTPEGREKNRRVEIKLVD